MLTLAFGFSFEDLHTHSGLARLDARFLEHLTGVDADLCERLRAARVGAPPEGKTHSDLLLAVAPHIEDFLAALFGIEAATESLRQQHHDLEPLFRVKRLFVQRRAAHAHTPEAASALDSTALLQVLELPVAPDNSQFELAFARAVVAWETDATTHAEQVRAALDYSAWALHTAAGRKLHGRGTLFQIPRKIDPQKLVPLERHERSQRDGFALTDRGCELEGALDQAHYCIGCHNQSKDSCSRGFRQGAEFRRNSLGVPLTGCPLEERISEFLTLKAAGRPLAALAMIMLDNPMVAATGHRICNDCMKACIYQKQQPVDIPQAETRTLKDVLALPWGFEIYSLLSRWNPLDFARPASRAPSGYKVLVVGLGPAGFTLAHHLLNEGHTVVAVDGLKIEPLPAALCGVDERGRRIAFEPVAEAASLWSPLHERMMGGFGGVAEYGITVRWDKNFLTLIRLLLERRANFTMIGGVRLGSTLTIEEALAAGFDHVALCVGAGKPTVLPLANGLARGVRQASDFLMALQLTGAARCDSIANLQVRLPIVVIGGGLTAIDTATESLAYYPVQVERFLERYESLVAQSSPQQVRSNWSEEERLAADEIVAHARAIRAERQAARAENRAPCIAELLEAWGGATIAYRRALTDAPAYRLNHEEVIHAMHEGVRFLEHATPSAVEVDAFGHASALRVAMADGSQQSVPARTILVAAGTQPNTVLADEESASLQRDGKYFKAIEVDGMSVRPEASCKPQAAHVLTNRTDDARYVSFFGDLHPSYAGNVVKAMASAKQGCRVVGAALACRAPTPVAADELVATMNAELRATVQRVERLTPTILEIVVHAPRAARRFRPGQFFRLQNFEAHAARNAGTTLAMEGLALTGATVDVERGLVSLIALEMGGSSQLCHLLRPGEPVVLMGPTGEPTTIPRNRTMCLVGGGLGNAVLFSIGQAARVRGNRVVYFAGYKTVADRYKVEEIEAAADVVVWSCDEAPGFRPGRPQDRAMVANIVTAMEAYASGALASAEIPLHEVDRMIVIGSDRMMAAVAAARRERLAPYLRSEHIAIGSINSPMQCMMKEICGQCLQVHRDPITNEERVVFSCANQDQPLDSTDFGVLRARLAQNSLQEKLTAQWVQRCLAAHDDA
jgi:NADPH-dependent glutamate synthase beta subunit-like oxidoreductase/NAD(P)H-flavin reductase